MISSFADHETEELFFTGKSRRFGAMVSVAQRKLQLLDNAAFLSDLRDPAENHLKALKGDRAGQRSIRIGKQYRICFIWKGTEAHEVEIVGHH